jgi:hypothetical protein
VSGLRERLGCIPRLLSLFVVGHSDMNVCVCVCVCVCILRDLFLGLFLN